MATQGFPLSAGQRALWFHQVMEPESSLHNLSFPVRATRPFEARRFRSTVEQIHRKYLALRMKYETDDSAGIEVMQREIPNATLDYQERDSISWSDEELQAELRRESNQHFDLSAEQGLFRARLYLRPGGLHAFILVFHHAAVDLWSLSALVEDLGHFYDDGAFPSEEELARINNGVELGDYQQALIQSERGQGASDFWKERIGEGLPAIQLGDLGSRPPTRDSSAETLRARIDGEVAVALRKEAAAAGVTVYAWLLTAFFLTLYRHTGQSDLVVGSPFAGRSRARFKNSFGFFVNPVLIRQTVSEDRTFSDLARKIHAETAMLLRRQDYPFQEVIARHLGAMTDSSRAPGYDVEFVYDRPPRLTAMAPYIIGAPGAPLHLGQGLSLESLELPKTRIDRDLQMFWCDDGEVLHGALAFATSILSPERADDLLRHFLHVLRQTLVAPTARIRDIEALEPLEERRIVDELNSTRAESPRAPWVPERILQRCAEAPSLPAVTMGDQQISYVQFGERVRGLADQLQKRGVGPEERVALVMERALELPLAIVSILAAGGAYAPLDPNAPDERLEGMLRETGARMLFTQARFEERLSPICSRLGIELGVFSGLEIEFRGKQPAGKRPRSPELMGDHMAYVIFTSGSTGAPKGVINHHAGLLNRLSWMQKNFPIGPSDRVLQKTPYTFDVSVWEFLWPLCHGATLVVALPGGHQDPSYLLEEIRRVGVTVLHFVPSMLDAFLGSRGSLSAPSVRRVFCSGEALSAESVRKLHDQWPQVELHNLYGPTEAAIDVSWYPCTRDLQAKVIPIGKPVLNTQLYVLDERLRPVPIGAPGEIYIGGCQLARGYINRPELTAERFLPDPFSSVPGARMYRTGDLGHYDRAGNVVYLGRKDFQIKVRGQRIELGEIESVLQRHPMVASAVVVARKHPVIGTYLSAYYTLKGEESGLDSRGLEAWAERQLPEIMVPRFWLELPTIPVSSSGKADRKSLPHLGPESQSHNGFSPAPLHGARRVYGSPSQRALAQCWSACLGGSEPDQESDFFRSGGHSLLAVQLVNRLREATSLSISLREVFALRTFGRISARLEEVERARLWNSDEEVMAVSPSGPSQRAPLTAAQRDVWVSGQRDPSSKAFWMTGFLRIQGPVQQSRERITSALERLERRHDALRVSIQEESDGLWQEAKAPRSGKEILACVESQSIDSLCELLEEPLDLSKERPWRAVWCERSSDEAILGISLHHIVADGASLDLLARELTGASADESPAPSWIAQAASLARMEPEGDRAESIAIWRGHLAGLERVLPLPRPAKPPMGPRNTCGSVFFRLRPEVVLRVVSEAATVDSTLFAGLLSAWQATLYRYTRTSNLLMGTPVSRRDTLEAERVVGFLVDTVPLRLVLDESETFREACSRTTGELLSASERPRASLQAISGALTATQGRSLASQSGLFEVMIAYQAVPRPEPVGLGLSAHWIDLPARQAKFPLLLDLRADLEGGITGRLEYDAARIDPGLAERIAGDFERLVSDWSEKSEQSVREAVRLRSDERAELALLESGPRMALGETRLETSLLQRSQLEPERLAVRCERYALSYSELVRLSEVWASELGSSGVGPGDRVAIASGREVYAVPAMFAAFRAGASFVPVDPSLPIARIRAILEISGARAVFLPHGSSEDSLKNLAQAMDLPVVGLARTRETACPVAPRIGGAFSDLDPAYILFTSGSTGTPKGVVIPHRSILNLLEALEQAISEYGSTRPVRFSVNAPWSFDASVQQWVALLRGHELVIVPDQAREDSREFLDFLAREGIEVLDCTPGQLSALVDEGLLIDPRIQLRSILVGGEAISGGLWDALRSSYSIRVYNVYGPTECTVDSTIWRITPDQATPVIGKPILNGSLYVVDEKLERVPLGAQGELVIGGLGVGAGYWQDPALTAESFFYDENLSPSGEQLYRTRDRVRWTDQGTLEFLGRLDGQVKLRGYRIEIGEIETVMTRSAGSVECAVVLLEDHAELVGFAVIRDATDWIQWETSVRAECAKRLPSYMIPVRFHRLESVPRTSSGKVDRRELASVARELRKMESLEPGMEQTLQTPTERQLAGIWQELLGGDSPGRNADFFERGGNSLAATSLSFRIRRAFSSAVRVRDVYEAPVLSDLAARIDANLGTQPLREIPARTKTVSGTSIERVPTSPSQARLWFLGKMNPEDASYWIQGAIRVQGGLDPVRFRKALKMLAHRHASLRTRLIEEDGQPIQEILPELNGDVPLQVHEGNPKELESFFGRERSRPFPSSGELPWRALLLRISENPEEWTIALTIHHLVSDGVSLGILLNELDTVYREGTSESLPALPIDYADYANWKRERENHPDFERQAIERIRHFEGMPLVIELPTDRPRPAKRAAPAGEVRFDIPESLQQKVRQMASRLQVTPFAVYLAAFETLLARISSQSDFAVGVPFSGRGLLELESLTGFLATTQVIRAQVDLTSSFAALVRSVREEALEAERASDVPFELLVQKLNPPRDMSRTPVFQVLFNLVPESRVASRGSWLGFPSEPLETPRISAKFDLTLEVRPGAIQAGLMEYDRELWDETTVSALARRFVLLLEAGCNRAEAKIQDLDLCLAEERERLLGELACPSKPWTDPEETTLPQLVEAAARKWPERVAIRVKDRSITYGALFADWVALVRRLREEAEIKRGDRVAIYLDRDERLITALLAVQSLGAAYVPMDPKYPALRNRGILEDSRPSAMITNLDSGMTMARDVAAGARVVRLDWPEKAASRQHEMDHLSLASVAVHSDVAYLIYTSGSTGAPKGIEIEHRNAVNLIRWAHSTYSEDEWKGVLGSTSICFDLSIFEIFATLSTGGTLHLVENVLALLEGPEKFPGLTLINTVPSAMSELLRNGAIPKSVRTINLAGEALESVLVREILASTQVSRVLNLYGPSETTTYSTGADVTTCSTGAACPIGRPIRNTHLYVLDEQMRPVPFGVPGELWIGGQGVARSYLGKPELTGERFRADPFRPGQRIYRTGDRVRFLADGSLVFLGRSDHQVKIRGYRIELGEVESMLAAVPSIRQSAVVAKLDPRGERVLVGYYSPAELEPPVALLRQRLPDPMIPRRWVPMSELPLLPNGKIDRSRLPSPQWNGSIESWTETAATWKAEDPFEREIQEIWCEILGIQQLRPEDEFFDLGGHSLLVTRLLARVRARLGLEISVAEVFSHAVFSAFVNHLRMRQGSASGGLSPILSLGPVVEFPLSDAQSRMWFLQRMSQSSDYNILAAVELQELGAAGDVVDTESRIEACFLALAARHDQLRTRFIERDGVPVQQVLDEPRIFFERIDAQEGDPEVYRSRELTREAHHRFDLGRDPLVRVRMLRHPNGRITLILNLHHIIADGWSIGLLLNELSDLWSLDQYSKEAPSAAFLRYSDYVRWQRSPDESARREGSLRFWTEKWEARPPELQLSRLGERGALKPRAERVSWSLDPAQLERLDAVAKESQATRFMVLLAAWAAVIHRFTDQPELAIGTAVANRPRAELEKVVGLFANTLALRLDARGNPSFSDLILRMKKEILEAAAHSDAPFDQVVERLRIRRNSGAHPLFQAMVILQTAHSVAAPRLPGLECTLVPVPPTSPKMDLVLILAESDQGLNGELEYDASLYSAELMNRLMVALTTVLRSGCECPGTSVGELPVEENWADILESLDLLDEFQAESEKS